MKTTTIIAPQIRASSGNHSGRPTALPACLRPFSAAVLLPPNFVPFAISRRVSHDNFTLNNDNLHTKENLSRYRNPHVFWDLRRFYRLFHVKKNLRISNLANVTTGTIHAPNRLKVLNARDHSRRPRRTERFPLMQAPGIIYGRHSGPNPRCTSRRTRDLPDIAEVALAIIKSVQSDKPILS